ncbi:hypothetical protein [Candidatus Epulonipiscium viviparus]|uniref:hypothetical protein n=1 Tax=Candidatus Epulonipiscium viviparus TaxID=420336 RepID=UPI0027381267|nr:hypothetical protein [Candidatus Epulopiscium viviparus]
MVNKREREYLRMLAKEQRELANLPIMAEKTDRWYAHNELKGDIPMIVMEELTFWKDISPDLFCENILTREIEEELLRNIIPYNLFGDDKIVPNYYPLKFEIEGLRYGLDSHKICSFDGQNFYIKPHLGSLKQDFQKLSFSNYTYKQQALKVKKHKIQNILGDILDVVPVNTTNHWNCSLTQQALELLGRDNMFYSITREPEEFKNLMTFLANDTIRLLRFQEHERCICLNNKNNYIGGSYCFSHELPQQGFNGIVKSSDTWGHINAQEFFEVSSKVFKEFILPETKRVAEEFGMIYYGCREPISNFWENNIDQIKNLRKVSVSALCDEQFIAPRLSQRGIIYSKQIPPCFLGAEKSFDEEAFRKYIKISMDIIRKNNCKAEFIFRDIYNIHGNLDKLRRAVEIVREESVY